LNWLSDFDTTWYLSGLAGTLAVTFAPYRMLFIVNRVIMLSIAHLLYGNKKIVQRKRKSCYGLAHSFLEQCLSIHYSVRGYKGMMKYLIYLSILFGVVFLLSGCGKATIENSTTTNEVQSENLESVSFKIDGFT